MKLKGVKLQGPNVELIVIPRGDGEPIVFKAQAVLDMEEFDRLCPAPEPPTGIGPGGVKVIDTEDFHYKAMVDDVDRRRVAYMSIKSLEATEELEWERVKIDAPSTWLEWTDELKEAGFSNVEVNRIKAGVMSANCLNEDKVNQARQRFLAQVGVAKEKSSSPMGVLSSGQSGEPARGSE